MSLSSDFFELEHASKSTKSEKEGSVGQETLNVFHQNAQCLSTKMPDYDVFFSLNRCDIFCVSEHWYLRDTIVSATVHNFELVDHYSRATHIHGGVAIFSAPHLRVQVVEGIHELSVDFHFEAAACRFETGGLSFVVMVIYRSNVGDREIFLERLDMALEILSKHKKHTLVVCGDFNYDFLESSCHLKRLLDVLHSCGLTVTIKEPTRLTRCLDNICVSEGECLYESGVVHNAISDHHGQMISLNLGNQAGREDTGFEYRQTNSFVNISYFKKLLRDADWKAVYSCTDVNTQYFEFYNLLDRYYRMAFPLRYRIKKPRIYNAEWITNGIKVSSIKIKELFLLMQSGVIPAGYYKKYRTVYRRVIRAAKKMHYNDLIQGSQNKVRTAWNIINGGNKKTKSDVCLNIDNEICTDYLKCANHFNTYFNSVADMRPDTGRGSGGNNISANDISFFLTPVTYQEVFREIIKLKPSSSCGFDKVSANLLRLCAVEVSLPLVHIINHSFQAGVFPCALKTARCVPVYKKKCPTLVENYRPLSILSTFSKLFEKLYCSRLLHFFNQCNLFNDTQHGFRAGRSTSTAIVGYLNSLYAHLDRGRSCVGVFLDLSRAFDLVNHVALLDKLYDYGVRGAPLSWLRTYLSERNHFVEIHGVRSETLTLNRGIPQGSVIGPLLYIIYTGDINLNNIVMYADDTSILSTGENLGQATANATDDLDNICRYFRDNELSLNIEKSVCINFTLSSVMQPSNDSPGLTVGLAGDPLSFVNSTKFLGVTIDECLRWGEHVDVLCERIARLCFTIKRLREYVDAAVLKLYYFAHVHSCLSYGIVAWGSCCEVERVMIMQKRALRCMAGSSRLESCRPLFRKFQIMTVISVYIYQLCLDVKLHACNYSLVQDTHKHGTRNRLLLRYPIHRTSAFECSPRYMSIRCYNKLPDNLKVLDIKSFKARLRRVLIDKAYYRLNEFLNDSFNDKF